MRAAQRRAQGTSSRGGARPAAVAPQDEIAVFKRLQRDLGERWRTRPEVEHHRDVVVVPSLSLEGLMTSAIPGVHHYEERMLFTLALLHQPRSRLVYITSEPINPTMIDYQVTLLSGIPAAHARHRLTLLSTYDSSPRPLTDKILERPRLIQRIREVIDPRQTHLTCFNVTHRERALAVRLGVPLFGVDPDLLHYGTKSGARRALREAGLRVPAGVEDVRTERDAAEAVADLWEADPSRRRHVIKLDDSFSGEGNALLTLAGLNGVAPGRASRASRVDRILAELPRMSFSSKSHTWETFRPELERLGGVVETFVEGKRKRSPSCQLRINPRGEVEVVSTHDQLLGGPDGQSYEGCLFPADAGYRRRIHNDTRRLGELLAAKGVIGRVAADYVAVERPRGGWGLYAIEINLRITGTTHPLMLLRMLTDGHYDQRTGQFLTRRKEPRCYVATDTLASPSYRGLLVEDLFDIAAVEGLLYSQWTDTGVVFHLTGALSQYGKLGLTAIGRTPREAHRLFGRARAVLDRETG